LKWADKNHSGVQNIKVGRCWSDAFEVVVFSGATLAIVSEISEKGEHCLSVASLRASEMSI